MKTKKIKIFLREDTLKRLNQHKTGESFSLKIEWLLTKSLDTIDGEMNANNKNKE